MRVYTVHFRDRGDEPEIELVREGFSWAALLIPVFWLLWHRMWWIFAAYIAVVAGLNFALSALGVGDATAFLVTLALALLFAWEADSLRRWSLARKGYRMIDMALGRRLAEAERAFFDRDILVVERPVTMPPPPRPGRWEVQGIGLFPETRY